jgi:CHAD domain-containing protein
MTNGTIKCGYCKESVSRNGYGKHILSKKHSEQFLKENEKVLKSVKGNKYLSACYVNETVCSICFVCKKFYIDKDTDSEVQRSDCLEHFVKHPDCKAKYLEAVKKVLIVKLPKKDAVSNEEVEKLQKEIKRLKKEVEMLQPDEEENERMERRSQMLEEILGNATDSAELESRFSYIKNNFSLPLFE